MSKDNSKEKNANHLFKVQPGVVLRMIAKPGKGSDLFDLCTELHYKDDPDGPVDWALCRSAENIDTLWAFEFYKDDEAFNRHYSNPAIDEGHDKVIDLLADMPLRADVHIVSSNYTINTATNAANEKTLYKNQPGMVLRTKAKPGKGSDLFDLCTELHYKDDPDGPVDWVLCQPNEELDIMWAFEFYRDDESFKRHYSNPEMDEGHQMVFDLCEVDYDNGVREEIHIVTSSSVSGS